MVLTRNPLGILDAYTENAKLIDGVMCVEKGVGIHIIDDAERNGIGIRAISGWTIGDDQRVYADINVTFDTHDYINGDHTNILSHSRAMSRAFIVHTIPPHIAYISFIFMLEGEAPTKGLNHTI